MAHAEQKLVLTGDPAIEVRLRRSPRARRLSLRVSQLDGRVTLSLPPRIGVAVARAFLDEKADWVRAHLNAQPQPVPVQAGVRFPVLGRETLIKEWPGKRSALRDGVLFVSAAKPASPQVAAVLKHLARERLAPACDLYAARIGRRFGRLTLRDTRSRWGSCTSEGNLMFSWRLAMAPEAVLNYVAAHEVAHLAEMNHGPAFWRLVEGMCPDYLQHRGWLRENGAHLHRVRFAK